MELRVLEDLRTAGIPDERLKFGPLVFKALMARLLSNDYSSTKALQANLEKLDLYSDEFKGDVRKFTETVKSSFEILSQREKRDANGRLTVVLTCRRIYPMTF